MNKLQQNVSYVLRRLGEIGQQNRESLANATNTKTKRMIVVRVNRFELPTKIEATTMPTNMIIISEETWYHGRTRRGETNEGRSNFEYHMHIFVFTGFC